MNLTEQQHEAITNHRQNLIVTAGAGSGKTRVLVERYLGLLDANPDWSLNALVAITFTKKAAEEMRDRVRKSLEDQLAKTGADRWANLLGQIDSARIDTIHGLCASILRANAAYAQLDPDFEVLDEVEAVILLQDAVDVAMQSEAAAPLILEYGVSGVRDVLRNHALLNQRLPEGDLLETWQQAWTSLADEQVALFKRQVKHIGTILNPPKADKLGEKWLEFLSCWHELLDAKLPDSYELVGTIAAMKIGNVGGKDAWGSKEAVLDARRALMDIRTAAAEVVELVVESLNAFDERAAELLPLWGQVIQQVKTQYQAIKGAALDFDDLEQLTCEVLHQPEVQARYRGTEFKHLLVDEFQDTNAYQWQIVKFLANLDQQGAMFVVGDQKQSIYGFRGADVSVFGDVQDEIVRHGGKLLPLSKSFRTHQPLVDCFNDLFDRLLVRDENSPVKGYQVTLGEPMTAHRDSPPNDAPCVEMILIPNENYDTEQCRQWEAYEIAQRIHALVQANHPIFDKSTQTTRPMRYDDVAILFRALTNVNLYEDVFKALHLPFVTVAGRGYYDRQEVQDLLNLLKAVYNPADHLSLASVLRSPMFGLSDDALLALRLEPDVPLWEAIESPPELLPDDERDLVQWAVDCLRNLRAIAGRVTIAELLQEALSLTGYLATLTALPDGARRRGNVEKLLEKAQTTGKVTLGAFTQYLADLTTIEAREGEATVDAAGAVTLMTIHASKGLEFPLVVLADASRKSASNRSSMVIYADEIACKAYDPTTDKFVEPFLYRVTKRLNLLKEEAQNLRLLYVALTRAQDMVMISGQAKFKDGLCHADGWLGQLIPLWSLDEVESSTLRDFPWGKLGVYVASEYPDIDPGVDEPDSQVHTDDIPDLQLLDDVVIERTSQARHLAASHIADLGGYETTTPPDQEFYRNRFRRRVLQDAPTMVETISPAGQVKRYQIGDMVHEALRYGRIPGLISDDQLRDLLEAYAWRFGITEQDNIDEAVQEGMKLLHRFANSDLFRDMQAARKVYREIPFIYERSDVIIHGVIDTLYQRQDESWVVADYKTSIIKHGEQLEDHARRYHLQIGIYAEAVERQLGGVVPQTVIHYIRYTRTVEIQQADWRKSLSRSLWDRVSEVVKEET